MLWNRFAGASRRPVDGHSLAVLRVVFGAVGLLSMVRILANGWIETLYAGPAEHFTYPGFGWVCPPSVGGMQVLVCVVAVASICIAAGWCFRPAMALFWIGFAWIELIDVTTYLNHYWFVTLAGALLLVAPVTAEWSPHASHHQVAVGWVWLLRGQVAVVYVFAGLAKLHADWLLHAVPLRLWLPARTHLPVVGSWLAEPWAAYVLAWAGALFDCTIVGLLLWRRTRLFAWLAVVAFHVATWRLFSIGVFPWLMIGATTLFFDPAWPTAVTARMRTLVVRDRRGPPVTSVADTASTSGSSLPVSSLPARSLPGCSTSGCSTSGCSTSGCSTSVSATSGSAVPGCSTPGSSVPGRSATGSRPRFVVGLAAVWMVLQIAIPMRHLVIAGDDRWTLEGYRFSWNVLLTERGGDVTFRVTDVASGRTWREDATARYTPLQWKAMSSDPELIRQAAHAIARAARVDGADVQVRVDAFVSWNGRPAARLIDPDVDLATQPWRPGHQWWILDAPATDPP